MFKLSILVAGFVTSFVPSISNASAGGAPGGLGLVSTISIAIVAASLLTILFTRFKLPALLAYIASGLLIGIFAAELFGQSLHMLNEVSHIGLVFLLFIIGMEMDPTAIRLLGFRTSLAIALQAPISIATIYALQWGLHQLGYALPGLASNPDGWIYYGVAASLSYVKSQGADAGSNSALIMIGGGILLAIAFVLVSRYLLSRVLTYLAKSPDLLTLVALGWCFLCAESMSQIGLSAEMGALIAGVTIGRLPQHTEVFSKVESLRDFFMALFFVALGISLPPPTLAVIGESLVLVAIVIVSRLLLYSPAQLAAKQGAVVSFTVPINLSQLSVFALLLIPVGIANGDLAVHDQLVISYALLFSVVLSTFGISNNYKLAMMLSNIFGLRAKKNHVSRKKTGDDSERRRSPEIIILGLHVNTEALARNLKETQPDLLKKILVIDFNLNKHKQADLQKNLRIAYGDFSNPETLRHYGIEKAKVVVSKHKQADLQKNLRIAYGDFSNPETLRHYGIEKAKVVVSTINNAFLHGVRNETLIDHIKALNPSIRIISTSLSSAQSEQLIKRGAYACVSTPDESAPAYTKAIINALTS
jgi:Kef-type K+ transport system membrane component KefB